jgi:hypothetical protein
MKFGLLMGKLGQKMDFPRETFGRLFFGGYLDPMEHIIEELAFNLSVAASKYGNVGIN